MPDRYLQHGELLGAPVESWIQDNGKYLLRIKGTPVVIELLKALGSSTLAHCHSSAGGYIQIEYTDELDEAIRDAIDVLADIRYGRPTFGQLRFTLEKIDDAT